jgi:hypothetical protein
MTTPVDVSATNLIAAWRLARRTPTLSKGGAVGPLEVPLEGFRQIDRDLSRWDEVQLDPLSQPPDLNGLDQEEAVEVIRAWFLANFEDPVHHTPYESTERTATAALSSADTE